MIKTSKETDDAGITAIMPIQRAREAESRARYRLSNGPLRAQSNVGFHKVFCDVLADVTCRGYGKYPAKRTGKAREFKVAPRISRFVLDRLQILSGTFFYGKPDRISGILFPGCQNESKKEAVSSEM